MSPFIWGMIAGIAGTHLAQWLNRQPDDRAFWALGCVMTVVLTWSYFA